jgi:hypothetical protein
MELKAGVYLINKEGKILIAHPTNHSPNFWSIPNFDISRYKGKLKELKPSPYKGNKMLYPFVLLESDTNINFSNLEFKCNSIVENGGFYEVDDFKWVSIEEAKLLLHYSQVPPLEEIINL